MKKHGERMSMASPAVLIPCWSAAALCLVFVCLFAFGVKNPIPYYIASFLLAALAVLLIVISFRRRKGGDIEGGDTTLLSSITKDYMLKNDSPMALMNEKNELIWYNSFFSDMVGVSRGLYGKSAFEMLGDSIEEEKMEELKKGGATRCSVNGSMYDLKVWNTSSRSKKLTFLTFENRDAEEEYKKELLEKRPAVALLVIDNYAEATRALRENQRSAITLIGNLLDEWCDSVGGILKEYEKNSYILILEESELAKLIENKFQILDKIKEIEVEGVSIPFTASIGVARIDGSFPEKLNTARNALDLAMQRGGDQAAVKTENGTEFFGGKQKSVQKRTKIRSRVTAEELRHLIDESGNVIIQGHRFADHDSIGSCMGIAHLALALGKETHIVVNINDANFKPIFGILMRGHNEILDILCDNVSVQDYLRSDTLAIVCDVNSFTQLEAPSVVDAARDIVIIDHHRKSGEFKTEPRVAYIEPSASSASELVAEILEHSVSPGELSELEANLLFAGILLDTKQFTKNTGVRTFGAAQYLRGEGADPNTVKQLFRTGIEELVKESRFETDVNIYYDVVAVSRYSGECTSEDRISMAKAADRLLGVNSIKASFVLCTIDGAVCISARSDGTINVQLICEALGGGGHYDAAAAQVKDKSIEEVEAKLLDVCAQYLSGK